MIEINITENEFYERFTPVKNHIIDAPYDGCMFETFSNELEFVKETFKKNPRTVWTILEADGNLYYSSGFHFVNRIGYLITEQEFEDGVEYNVDLEGNDHPETDKFSCDNCGHSFPEKTNNGEGCPWCGDKPTQINGKYQCGSCEQFFDEPTSEGECPHCGSGNYVEGCIDE